MRILLVEDEKAIREHVSNALNAAGYQVECCDNGPQAWELGQTNDYSAVILDLGLPGLDGLTLLKRWRADGVAVPVLVLTARGSWMERVDGFDSGADDYLPKPFRTEELLARLRALLRRSNGAHANVRSVGRLVIDDAALRISLDGKPVDVTPMEFRALVLLAGQPGRAHSVSEIAAAVQGREDDNMRNSVEVMVNRLRRKLGDGVILTRRGFGYCLADDRP